MMPDTKRFGGELGERDAAQRRDYQRIGAVARIPRGLALVREGGDVVFDRVLDRERAGRLRFAGQHRALRLPEAQDGDAIGLAEVIRNAPERLDGVALV